MYLPGLPRLAGDLHSGASQAQLTLTACLVGLAAGQLLVGPISDAFGRRRPLIVGLIGYAVASGLCALAPEIWTLTAVRLVQGLAGGAGIVIARAVVRDGRAGRALSRYFALLMLVNGIAPILAPVIGGQLLRVTSWRGVFVVLTGIGLLLLGSVLRWLPETLEPAARHTGGLAATVVTFRALLRDRPFVGYALSSGLVSGAMFAYISGSPFVLQDVYGLSPQQFSLVFGANALGLVLLGQLGGALVHRVDPATLLRIGIAESATGAVLLLVAVLGGLGLPVVLPALLLVVSSVGLVAPNAMALALDGHGAVAGSAAALLGVAQYIFGAAVAPLVGIAGSDSAVPLAVLIGVLAAAAVGCSAIAQATRAAAAGGTGRSGSRGSSPAI